MSRRTRHPNHSLINQTTLITLSSPWFAPLSSAPAPTPLAATAPTSGENPSPSNVPLSSSQTASRSTTTTFPAASFPTRTTVPFPTGSVGSSYTPTWWDMWANASTRFQAPWNLSRPIVPWPGPPPPTPYSSTTTRRWEPPSPRRTTPPWSPRRPTRLPSREPRRSSGYFRHRRSPTPYPTYSRSARSTRGTSTHGTSYGHAVSTTTRSRRTRRRIRRPRNRRVGRPRPATIRGGFHRRWATRSGLTSPPARRTPTSLVSPSFHSHPPPTRALTPRATETTRPLSRSSRT